MQQPEIKKTSERNDNKTRKRVSGSSSNTISDTRSGFKSKNSSRNGNADNSTSSKTSKATVRNIELEDAIDKQKDFLRKFI